MTVCPLIAAVVLVRRQAGSAGVKRLLRRAFDYSQIKPVAWYLPILLFWPAVTVLAFGLMKLAGVPLPDPELPGLMLPVSFAVFALAAVGEEVGWQGYALDPLQEQWNALLASILIGIVWAAWHIIPFLQMGRTPAWIAWQALGMIVARILTVWLYNNTGRSVLAAILFHAMNNVATVLLPTYGWPYNPALALAITAATAMAITFLWGPKTLSRFRYARSGREIQVSATS
jgi:membrane protease YdiL (CAAX protease family)